MRLTASKVAAATGGRLVGDDAHAKTVVADSRQVSGDAAFAAVAGGHAFVAQALAAGAPFAIVDREDAVVPHASVVVVDDVVRALMSLATAIRTRIDVPVIGITGSTGKTLTKDFLAAALGSSLRVHATPKSYNAELGVPLTLLGAPGDAEILVIELAARHAGEIAELCAIVRPSSGVITGIGGSHLEEFGSREAIARTKSELLAALGPGGAAFVPSADDFLDVLVASTTARIVTVGAGGAVRYRADRVDAQGRTHGSVTIGAKVVPVVLPVAGRALMRNAAFAIAAAVEHGVDASDAAEAISASRPSAWRMEIRTIGERVVVNDAYNANPTSVASSLRAVHEMASERPRWAVLGHMAELGADADGAHRHVGALAAALGYDGVVVVGAEAAQIAVGAGPIAIRVGSLAEAVDVISEQIPSEAVVVVKASRVAGLERLVDLLEDQLGRTRQVG